MKVTIPLLVSLAASLGTEVTAAPQPLTFPPYLNTSSLTNNDRNGGRPTSTRPMVVKPYPVTVYHNVSHITNTTRGANSTQPLPATAQKHNLQPNNGERQSDQPRLVGRSPRYPYHKHKHHSSPWPFENGPSRRTLFDANPEGHLKNAIDRISQSFEDLHRAEPQPLKMGIEQLDTGTKTLEDALKKSKDLDTEHLNYMEDTVHKIENKTVQLKNAGPKPFESTYRTLIETRKKIEAFKAKITAKKWIRPGPTEEAKYALYLAIDQLRTATEDARRLVPKAMDWEGKQPSDLKDEAKVFLDDAIKDMRTACKAALDAIIRLDGDTAEEASHMHTKRDLASWIEYIKDQLKEDFQIAKYGLPKRNEAVENTPEEPLHTLAKRDWLQYLKDFIRTHFFE